GPDASPPEKIYYVLSGELTVIAGGKETVAKAGDSVYIGPNESREIINRSNEVCTIAVAVAPVKRRRVAPSSSAKADDPVIRHSIAIAAASAITGCPACA